MRQRLEDVGGRFEIDSAAEGGTVVRLIAPLKRG
jgi:signal transduction histidine kinase